MQMTYTPIIILITLATSVITLVNTSFGFSVLIVSMLFSPELEVANLPQHAVAVRIEDFLLFAVFFAWLAKVAMLKGTGLFKKTPLNLPIALFIVTCLLSTLIGMATGTVKGTGPSFFILKYVEYFLLYFMFVNVLEDEKQKRHFLNCALATCLIVCLYTLSQYGQRERVGAPFEGEYAEPASLGGYLLFMMGVVLGLWLYTGSKPLKFFLSLLLLLLPAALVVTTSRASFLSIPPLYLTILWLTKRKKAILILLLLLSPLLIYTLVPPRIIEFTKSAFTGATFQIGGRAFKVGYSAAGRLWMWKNAFNTLKQNPILGMGVTGVGIVDNQYIRYLGETGVLGLSIFFWLLLRIFLMAHRTFHLSQENESKGLALGFLGGFVGLLTLGFSTNSFIIIRIMEPFWFMAAVVSSLPYLEPPSIAAQPKTDMRAA